MNKTAEGLVKWAEKYVGHPYWYGTFGQKPTEALMLQKKAQFDKQRLFSHYQASRLPIMRRHIAAGKEVFDCVGLIQGYMWHNGSRIVYNAATDVNANGMHLKAKTKGPIASMPDRPGLLVWFNNHIGIYVGNGNVIEARGFNHGVQLTRLSQRPWREWSECPFIAYKPAGPELTFELNGRNILVDMEIWPNDNRSYFLLEGRNGQKHPIHVSKLAEVLGTKAVWDAATKTVKMEVR